MADMYRQRFAELDTQLKEVLSSKKSVYDELTNRSKIEIQSTDFLEWRVKAKNLLVKACGPESEHYKEFMKYEQPHNFGTYLDALERLQAIFIAAREDYEGGYLRSTRTLVQAEVFDSELDQAKELHRTGYTLAAAIVAGVVLETTIRELCDRAGIPHAKLDKMNADLVKAGKYNVIKQKQITGWAGIRNAAAHGHPDQFSDEDVSAMMRDIERFISEQL